jgi:Ca2+-transporting ATPase
MLILTNLSWAKSIFEIVKGKNPSLWWVLLGTLFALLAVLYIPFLRALFHFSVLSVLGLAIAFGGGIVSLVWFEGFKLVAKRFRPRV